MKFKSLLIFSCCVSAVFAYTQSDLLAVQYAYQADSDKVTNTKSENHDASAALAKAKSKLAQAQKNLAQAKSELQAAQGGFNNSESSLAQSNSNFGLTNKRLNQIWNSLNPSTTPSAN